MYRKKTTFRIRNTVILLYMNGRREFSDQSQLQFSKIITEKSTKELDFRHSREQIGL